jgi:Bor protein
MKKITLLFAAACALTVGGCYTTTLRSGLPPGRTPLDADKRWHSGFLGGTQEASGPYDVDRLCPEGWSEIKTETSFANGIVELFSVSVYNPQTIEVTCAAPAPKPAKEAAATPPAQSR